MLPRIGRGSGDRSLQLGDQGRGTVLRPAPRIDGLQGIYRQVVAAHAVEDHHVEGGRRGALLFEAAHVEAVDVDVAVHDLVERAPVAVEGEDDLLDRGKQLDEARLAHPVRVDLAWEEGHQVHDVDDADLEFGGAIAQPVRGRHGLQGGDVAGTAENDVGLFSFGHVGSPLPHGGACGGVSYRRLHVEPLGLRLLVDHDQVHVVAAAQAVVGDREEGVGVGWPVDACDGASLGEHHVDEARPLVREAVVVVAPGRRGQKYIERGDRLPPGEVGCLLQPLGVLHYHGGGDHREGLVGREEAVAAGQEVALEPALAQMLAQDLKDPTVVGDVVGVGYRRADEAAVLDLEYGAEAVGVDLVRAEEPEVSLPGVPGEGVAQKLAKLAGRLVAPRGGLLDFQRVAAEVGQVEVFDDPAAVGGRTRAHATVASRSEGGKLRDQTPLLIKQLFGAVGAHPLFQHRELLRVGPDVRQRHLVGAEGALDRQAVHFPRPSPALGRAQHDSGPARTSGDSVLAPLALDSPDAFVAGVQRRCERLVHRRRSVPLDEVDLVAVPFEQVADLVVGGTTQHGGVGNLVAVEVQNRQDRSVAYRVEEADGLPGAFQGTGLGLAVADHGGNEEVWVVEGGTEGVGEDVAELTALVDRAWGGHAHVARHPAWRRELPEQAPHTRNVLRNIGIDLGVGAFEVDVRQDGRAAMPGSGQIDDVGVVLLYEAVEVSIDEAEAGRGTPVPE